METVAVNFHDETGKSVGQFNLKVGCTKSQLKNNPQAGDDAVGVQWKDIDSSVQLYASHKQFIEAVAKLRDAYW